MAVAQAVRFSMGSFQAKTYFAELLRRVESGAVVTITRNGHDVAVMQSPRSVQGSKAVQSWRRLMALSGQLGGGSPVTSETIQEWKLDGRK